MTAKAPKVTVTRDPHRSSMFQMAFLIDLEAITTAKPPLRGQELEEAVDIAVGLARDAARAALLNARDKINGHP